MKEFTYQDYLLYERLKFKEIHENLQLREPEVKYNVHQPHDKILKIVLEENREILKRTIAFILDGKIDEINKEELLKKLEREEKSMVLEVLRKESEKQRREGRQEGRREGRRQGKKEGIKENTFFIAKKMLERNMKITDIEEITGLSVKQIEKLKV